MLKIRLTRRGKKNKAFFRIVVAEHTSPIKGRFVEALGFLNPHTKEKDLKADRIKFWLEKGAQCSDTVHNLLVANGIVKGPKRAVRIKKKAEAEKKGAVSETEPSEVAEVKPENKEVEKSTKEVGDEKKKDEAKTEDAELQNTEKKENIDEKK